MAQSSKSAKTITAVGLDIGSHSVKCVEITHGDGSIKLHRVSILPVPDNTAKGWAEVLKVMMEPMTATKRLRISVSGSSLLIRRISLPIMTPAELKGAIRFEAESHIPFPIDDCVLDFQILNRDDEKKLMNVLLVAAKKDFIQDRLKVLSELNIHPELIDVDIFCLINAFEMLGDEQQKDRTYGLLNIGHQVSSFAIIQGKQPFFVREIPLGGYSVTKALAEIKGVADAEADQLKTEKDPAVADSLKEATERGFEQLVSELSHSIDYFENESGEELHQIWMSGGGALSVQAAEILSKELGKQVALWDNTKKMEIFGQMDQKYLAEHSAELNVAFGMVLRDTGKKK